MTYKLFLFSWETEPHSVVRFNDDGSQTGIPFNPDNTDYQQFKQTINDGKAELQDADGNAMSAEDAKQFVSTLP